MIPASTQQTDHSLMDVSQWMAMSRVIAEQQTNTCPQVISVQRTDSGLMTVLQQTAKLRVVANRPTYLLLHATTPQAMHATTPQAMLQRTIMPRVVARPQADTSPIAKSAPLCRQNTPRLWRNVGLTPERREVRMIFREPREVGSG